MYKDVIIKESEIDGKGVFAINFIPKGTIFVCDVILIPKNIIKKHSFPFTKLNNCYVIGFATFCNSSTTPNLKILSINIDKLTKSFITLEDILPNTEITLNYKF